MIFRLALRNVWRNTRRSLLTVTGIAVALALMMISRSINEGQWGSLIGAAIQGSAGHVVVQRETWQKERTSELSFDDSAALATKLRAAYPDTTVVRRTWVGGLLTSARNSAAVTIEGIEPDIEATLTLLDERLKAGAWLDDERGILLGDKLADTLAVGLGDKVVFMTQVGDRDMDSRLFRVKGLFHTGSEMLDGFGAIARIDATQAMLGGRDPAHQVAVVVPSGGKLALSPAPAEAAIGDRAGLEVLTWRQALPLLEEQEAVDTSFAEWMYLVMGVIVAVGVLNTVLMSVMERVREFGVLRALGMKIAPLFGMIVIEGLVLGILGAVGSIALATPAIAWLGHHGIDLGDLASSSSPVGGVVIDTVLRARPIPEEMALYAGLGVLMALLASIWPAWKAARLRPIDAIHHT